MKKATPGDDMVVDKRDGILDPVQRTDGPRDMENDFLAKIDRYEAEGHDILKAAGYPSDSWELLKRTRGKPLPPRISDVFDMLMALSLLRDCIQKNDLFGALWAMEHAVQKALRARIRRLEPDIFRGIKTTQGASEGGRAKAEKISKERHVVWKSDAEALRAKHPSNSNRSIAETLAKRYFANPELKADADTIARVIRKK